MPRRNRVDPWGDLNAAPQRGLFTGNRGCLVDDSGSLVRHHRGNLWIVCVTEYRDWRHPLDAPRTWTPLFFLDDAVALAAGHRPCGLCRRSDYLAYRDALSAADGAGAPPGAEAINRRLSRERLRRGRGLDRTPDRIPWRAQLDDLPVGTVVVDPSGLGVSLVTPAHLQRFGFGGWAPPRPRPGGVLVEVLTPPTSVAALENGYRPTLHPSAHRGPQ